MKTPTASSVIFIMDNTALALLVAIFSLRDYALILRILVIHFFLDLELEPFDSPHWIQSWDRLKAPPQTWIISLYTAWSFTTACIPWICALSTITLNLRKPYSTLLISQNFCWMWWWILNSLIIFFISFSTSCTTEFTDPWFQASISTLSFQLDLLDSWGCTNLLNSTSLLLGLMKCEFTNHT